MIIVDKEFYRIAFGYEYETVRPIVYHLSIIIISVIWIERFVPKLVQHLSPCIV